MIPESRDFLFNVEEFKLKKCYSHQLVIFSFSFFICGKTGTEIVLFKK
jgi:hypothetical protein